MTYRVRNWENVFENAASRQRGKLFWVPMPNHHDSGSFATLLEHPDGLSHYGCWALIVQVASKCQPRGTLLTGNCQPIDSRMIARIVRGNPDTFNAAIKRLLEIGWLEVIADCQPTSSRLAADCQPTSIEEKEEKEGKKTYMSADADRAALESSFLRAWNELGHPFSKIAEWSKKRKAAFKTRASEKYFSDNWKAALTRMQASSFCRGGGSTGWVANVEFFLKPDSVAKILEGKYDGNGKRHAPPPKPSGPSAANMAEMNKIIEENKRDDERYRVERERARAAAFRVPAKPNGTQTGNQILPRSKVCNVQDMSSVVPQFKSCAAV